MKSLSCIIRQSRVILNCFCFLGSSDYFYLIPGTAYLAFYEDQSGMGLNYLTDQVQCGVRWCALYKLICFLCSTQWGFMLDVWFHFCLGCSLWKRSFLANCRNRWDERSGAVVLAKNALSCQCSLRHHVVISLGRQTPNNSRRWWVFNRRNRSSQRWLRPSWFLQISPEWNFER